MIRNKRNSIFLLNVFLMMLFSACISTSKKKQDALFEVLDGKITGLDFTNKLSPSDQFNIFHYMYYYNGAGVAAGDFNNDGLIDLFFAANQKENKIYLNTGNLHFKDATVEAKIPQDKGWSTGVSVVDINNDGLLDLYICRVGKYEVLNSHNQFLICKGIDKNGVPFYEDKAKDYGLDFSGFSTQAAFLDYDMDGDLDMYLLNHSIHENGTFGPRQKLLNVPNAFSGDHIFRNDGNVFAEVTKQTGINSSVIGYGLGITVADINLDGYPDIYVGNDFHENDYLYINQKNGTFKEQATECMMHTSKFSMGVDVADINNDALPEIISMDMLPSDPYILKRSGGEDDYDIFNLKIRDGYNYQYSRNNLQFNRGNGMFSEVGLYSGIAATDWSWSPLWMDFDNDGLKDLFISNGIPKRLNDIDYINYISNDEVQLKIRMNNFSQKDMSLVDKFPQIKIPNKFYYNIGQFSFKDMGENVEGDKPTYSNGALYADFDNDGDLDIVVNNIDDPVIVYKNKANDHKNKTFIELKLKGPANNVNAVGSKVIVFADGGMRTYEKYPVHGFLSSTEIPIHIGLAKAKVDSVVLVWPDNTYQHIDWQKDTSKISTTTYQPGLPKFNYTLLTGYDQNISRQMSDITEQVNFTYKHDENLFIEFDRERLIPHMVSKEGPALAVGDINGDGYDDVFIGASKRNKPAVFIQNQKGKFEKTIQADLDNDSTYEDVDAYWVDVNNDKNVDLVVASGGNEYYGHDDNLLPRVYLNNGKGKLTKLQHAFDAIYVTASCVAPYDFNGDGFTDLFIGGRAVPWNYGATPKSYLLLNDGTGRFKDVTNIYAQELSDVGLVTQGLWFDIDKDGDKDLIVSLEWNGICAFINNKGRFTKKYLTDKKGWWNFAIPCDIDKDGDIDLIAGNIGLNSRLKASDEQPVRLYYNDFDNNGTKEQVLTYYQDNREIPFANKDDLQKQMPSLKKKFLYAEDFAKASLYDLFSKEKLETSRVLTANYFSNAILINDGKLNFNIQPMPWQTQLSSYRDAIVVDANKDNLPDILLAGNFYENNISMGRYDADFGTILINKGGGKFIVENINGLHVTGQARHVRRAIINNREAFILARNDDSAMVIQFSDLIKK